MANLSIAVAENYALNEVPESERRTFQKHVASCPKCADLLGEQLVWVAQMRSPFKRKIEKDDRGGTEEEEEGGEAVRSRRSTRPAGNALEPSYAPWRAFWLTGRFVSRFWAVELQREFLGLAG